MCVRHVLKRLSVPARGLGFVPQGLGRAAGWPKATTPQPPSIQSLKDSVDSRNWDEAVPALERALESGLKPAAALSVARQVLEASRQPSLFRSLQSCLEAGGVVIDYSAFVAAYAREGDLSAIMSLLRELHARGVQPDTRCYRPAVLLCTKRGDSEALGEIVEWMRADGAALQDTIIWKTLTSYYAQEGRIDDVIAALELVMSNRAQQPQQLQQRQSGQQVDEDEEREHRGDSEATFVPATPQFCASLLRNFAHRGHLSEAAQLLQRLRFWRVAMSPSAYLFVLVAFAEHGSVEAAVRVVRDMQADGVEVDEQTFNAVLRACAVNRNIVHAREVLQEMRAAGLQPTAESYGWALQACEEGQWEHAVRLLADADSSDVLLDMRCLRIAFRVLDNAREPQATAAADALYQYFSEPVGGKSGRKRLTISPWLQGREGNIMQLSAMEPGLAKAALRHHFRALVEAEKRRKRNGPSNSLARPPSARATAAARNSGAYRSASERGAAAAAAAAAAVAAAAEWKGDLVIRTARADGQTFADSKKQGAHEVVLEFLRGLVPPLPFAIRSTPQRKPTPPGSPGEAAAPFPPFVIIAAHRLRQWAAAVAAEERSGRQAGSGVPDSSWQSSGANLAASQQQSRAVAEAGRAASGRK